MVSLTRLLISSTYNNSYKRVSLEFVRSVLVVKTICPSTDIMKHGFQHFFKKLQIENADQCALKDGTTSLRKTV